LSMAAEGKMTKRVNSHREKGGRKEPNVAAHTVRGRKEKTRNTNKKRGGLKIRGLTTRHDKSYTQDHKTGGEDFS